MGDLALTDINIKDTFVSRSEALNISIKRTFLVFALLNVSLN